MIVYFIVEEKDEGSEKLEYTGDGSVDSRGRPVLKKNTGNWRACPFILGMLYISLMLLNNPFFVYIPF